MNMARSIREEAIANSVGGGGVAGLTGEPPVNLKRKENQLQLVAMDGRTWMLEELE